MDTALLLLIAGIAAALTAVALITRALTRSRLESRFNGELARLQSDCSHWEQRNSELRARLEQTRDEIPGLIRQAVAQAEQAKDALLEAREAAHAEAMRGLEQRFDETLDKVTAQLKGETEEMLRQRQKEFAERSGETIGNLLGPMKDRLENLRKTVEENSTAHRASEKSLRNEIESLMKFTGEVSQSANSLAAAFKYGNKLQGTWGETILEELLSSQGLTRGIHFDIQPTLSGADGQFVRNENGSLLRPDVILHLDTRREVIIDAKTSLSAYVSYVNAETEEERARFLKAHVESIRSHVRELARKDYAAFVRPPKMSAGYVIMFGPNMGALWTALQAEPDLWRQAARQNVYIADEQSLYGAIRIVQLTWTQVQQARNQEKVFSIAGEIVDRIDKFLTSYHAVGTALEAAAKAYSAGEKKLLPNGRSIVNSAAKLVRMGAPSKGKTLNAMIDIEEIPGLEGGRRLD